MYSAKQQNQMPCYLDMYFKCFFILYPNNSDSAATIFLFFSIFS